MAEYQRLKKGISYNMLVVRTELKPKPFEKKGKIGLFYSHNIFFEDENGRTYKGEYVLQSDSQFEFRNGQKVDFYVETVGEFGDEIKPGKSPYEIVPPESKPAKNTSAIATYAMAYAKDIFIAQINSGYTQGDYLEPMFEMARQINEELLKMQQQS